MTVDWCVLRTSLFPRNFCAEDATPQERERFYAAVGIASSNVELAPLMRSGGVPRVQQLYQARVRGRSTPRSLFAAAAIATTDGAELHLRDVEVQRAATADEVPSPAVWVVSPSAVFHADGVTLYRRDDATRQSEAVRLGVPLPLREVLAAGRRGTREQWEERLVERGYSTDQAGATLDQLQRMGLLETVAVRSLWNDDEVPRSQDLGTVVAEANASLASGTRPANAFATFSTPAKIPAALEHAPRVGQLLMRWSRSEVPVVQRLLAEQLDGRWLPLPELERMAQGLLDRAKQETFRPSAADAPYVRWLRARALDEEIDLANAPLPPAPSGGPMFLGTQWTADGELVGPKLFPTPPHELVARYPLPGLCERLGELALPGAASVMLAYRGPGSLAEVAEVHMPGTTALEYCGHASDPDRALRLEDLEVCASATTIYFRTRADQRPVTLVRPIPYNESMTGLHPLVRLLSVINNAELPCRSLIQAAFEGLPVCPRVTFEGHVLMPRRATLPRELAEDTLGEWLSARGLDGAVCVGTGMGGLRFDPREDDAVRRDIFKRLRRGERVRICEHIETQGVGVDGELHEAHALVPIFPPAPAAPLRMPCVPRPHAPERLRGPFRTVRVHALAERMPTVLRRLHEDLRDTSFFYVFLSDAVETELRLRIPVGAGPTMHSVTERLDELLDGNIIRQWALEPYVREWERYGGGETIEALERLFVADSASLYEPCATYPLVDPRRTNLYALTIVQTMSQAGLGHADQIALCRRAFDAYSEEFHYSAADRRALGEMWRRRRGELIGAAVGEGDKAVHDALVRRRDVVGRWLVAGNQERLRTHIRSVVHMTGTRLHFRHNRTEEAWAYFLARNLLDRWRHLPAEAAATAPWRQ